MKIAKGLKIKNELKIKLSHLQSLLIQHNSSIVGSTNDYNTEEVLKEYIEVRDKLILLKTNLQKATLPIYQKIFRISELKATIKALRSMNTISGKTVNSRYGGSEVIENIATIGNLAVDKKVKDIEFEISNLQDEIDEFNNTTNFEF